MAAKKKAGKKQPAQSDRTIQYVGGALILLVLGFFVRQYVYKPAVTPAFVGDVGVSFDCSVYDSIPQAAQYTSVPPMEIDPMKSYFANFEMENGGKFIIQLYSDKAPITVNNFVFLTCKEFYNGVTFHRVMDGFMAQSGDPTGTGTGSAGYRFEDEFSDLTFSKAGLLAMANSGPNTNASQFFITFVPTPHLNGVHTIFGHVVDGMEVVYGITKRDPSQNPAFAGDAIKTLTITE